MAQLRLTKNELRLQQAKRNQLLRYLPTLQLKKALLQTQVAQTRQEIHYLDLEFREKQALVEEYASLLSEPLSVDIFPYVRIADITKHFENIAGSDVPVFEEVFFHDIDYELFDTPVWLDGMVFGLRAMSAVRAKLIIAEERKKILEKELREVAIRVNLFEKILIPRAENNIRKIRVFLGDQMLSAISQAKVAKMKIELTAQSHEVAHES